MGPVPDWSRRPAARRRKKAKPATGTMGEAHAHATQGARRRRRQPSFVRQAEHAAFWRRPWVRAGLGTMAGALMVLLGAQAAYQYRDDLAARAPALEPALHAGCAWLGCRLAAPLALERIRLDSSDLTRTEREQVLRFTAELHNTADHAVRRPALEVTFTDSRIARLRHHHHLPRALCPADHARQVHILNVSSWCRRCGASTAAAPATSPTACTCWAARRGDGRAGQRRRRLPARLRLGAWTPRRCCAPVTPTPPRHDHHRPRQQPDHRLPPRRDAAGAQHRCPATAATSGWPSSRPTAATPCCSHAAAAGTPPASRSSSTPARACRCSTATSLGTSWHRPPGWP
jgi:hypothetical protein